MIAFLVLLVLYSAKYVHTLGAPVSACSSMTPLHPPYSPQSLDNSPFSLQATLTQNNEVTVVVEGSRSFKGILLQARTSINGSAVGSWVRPESENFQLLGCHGLSSSAVTQANLNEKPLPVSFTWLAPSVPITTTYTFYATIVQNFTIFYVMIPSSPVTVESSIQESPSTESLVTIPMTNIVSSTTSTLAVNITTAEAIPILNILSETSLNASQSSTPAELSLSSATPTPDTTPMTTISKSISTVTSSALEISTSSSDEKILMTSSTSLISPTTSATLTTASLSSSPISTTSTTTTSSSSPISTTSTTTITSETSTTMSTASMTSTSTPTTILTGSTTSATPTTISTTSTPTTISTTSTTSTMSTTSAADYQSYKANNIILALLSFFLVALV